MRYSLNHCFHKGRGIGVSLTPLHHSYIIIKKNYTKWKWNETSLLAYVNLLNNGVLKIIYFHFSVAIQHCLFFCISSFHDVLIRNGFVQYSANEYIHECILMWSNQRLIVVDESSLSSRSTVIWYLIDIRSLAYTCSKIRIDSLEFDMLKSRA